MHNFDNDLESTIQRYLKQQLSEEQAMVFEDYFVDKPDLIYKIESARAMMQGLDALGPQSAEFLSASDKLSFGARLLEWLRGPVPAYAIAICALAFVGVRLWLPIPQSSQSTDMSAGQIELLSFSSAAQRNGNYGVLVELEEQVNANHVAFIKLAEVKYRQYELSVVDPDSKNELWRSKAFVFSALNDKMISLPNSLAGKSVQLELFGIEQSGSKVAVEFCHYSEICQPGA